MKIKAESGITTEVAPAATSDSPVTCKKKTARSSRGSIPKKMRHAMTPAQRSFWCLARLHPRLHGKISRNQWVGCDLVDLVCHDSRLVIEFDAEPSVTDARKSARDERLRMFGYQVLRIDNREVLSRVRAVLERIAQMVDRLPAQTSGHGMVTAPAIRSKFEGAVAP